MKIQWKVTLILLIIIFTGCGIFVFHRYSEFRLQRGQLNSEARDFANKFLKDRLIKCGEYEFGKWIYPRKDNLFNYEHKLYQFKEVMAIPVERDSPSFLFPNTSRQSVWLGKILIISAKFRIYDEGTYENKGKWEPWSEETKTLLSFEIPFGKSNGEWSALKNVLEVYPDFDCDKIPK